MNSSPPFFHTCIAYVSSTCMKKGWATVHVFTVIAAYKKLKFHLSEFNEEKLVGFFQIIDLEANIVFLNISKIDYM